VRSSAFLFAGLLAVVAVSSSSSALAAADEPVSAKPVLDVKPRLGDDTADEDGAQGIPGAADYSEIEALRAKAAKEGAWELDKSSQISVDQQVLRRPWNKVPFDQQPFSYTHEQIRDNWDKLMGDMAVPYPSAKMLRDGYEQFPEFREGHPGFDGDFEKLERELGDVWHLFLRGDFQASMQRGQELGPMGKLAGKVAQVFYAIYLEPNLENKHMLLQDSANMIREFGNAFEKMKKSKDPVMRNNYVIGRLAYTYAIGRIAEDVPIATAITRNYVFKLLDAANDVLDLQPNNPLGLAFRAGIDANVVRKVGKATGRITFGAKQTDVTNYFERALNTVPNMAIIRYEKANAMLYMNKKREIEAAIAELKKASTTKPRFSMEALDAMYAAKRMREVEALAKWPGSFRSFERKRLRHQKASNQNLYCVLPKVCPPYIVE